MLNLIKELKVKVGFLGGRGGQALPPLPMQLELKNIPLEIGLKGMAT